ncbi:hypothetical protein [Methanobacterium formicicum]|uniref:Roadblock/LC7 family protein n=1 Tax=Methanobacterium formicicum (strain DSM 3637 / PP1) TaxID=1204725 RepID=K2R0F8_METFP|nr:hypothetical protein [Methanobacterium formicicum]EKF84667.1 Roadblock/LC7 family protein [Methanobacterium formicicum DSM 3637]
MTETRLKMQLEKATLDLDKTSDVEGILIVASDGRILHHNLRVDVDINLFGPMSQVISSSSLRLLSSSGQGEMERVLVESLRGKALFLGLENAHLIILMQESANVGMVIVNAKRASQKINEVTHDLELEVPVPEETPTPEEIAVEQVPIEEVPVEDISIKPGKTGKPEPETVQTEAPMETTVTEPGEILENSPELELTEEPAADKTSIRSVEEPVLEITEKITAEPLKDETEPAAVKPIVTEETPIEIDTDSKPGTETKIETGIKVETEVKSDVETEEIEIPEEIEELKVETEPETTETEIEELKPSIPTVRPPISFPSLPKHVKIPEDPEKRSDLILNIYESIFLAMSLGAAKIMGVAPARGLTKKFLPFEKCRRLLEDVDLKSNATIDFTMIKKNAAEIPLQEREEIFIQDFNGMIEVITENYGRVMGYEAFRAMVRPEFLEIKKSYGEAMDKLNIKKSMHPEIAQLFM